MTGNRPMAGAEPARRDEERPTAKPIKRALAKRIAKAWARADRDSCFGPSFFMGQLGALVRASCPTVKERIGIVEMHLLDGEVLEVCHIINLTPSWVALAVFDDRHREVDGQTMRTELVPYPCIARITISSDSGANGRIGFGQQTAPEVTVPRPLPAEELLERAAGRAPPAAG